MRSGQWAYKAGTGGATVSLPPGAIILSITAAGGTGTIFAGQTITFPATGTTLRFLDEMVLARTSAADVVFAGTTMYFIEYYGPTGL